MYAASIPVLCSISLLVNPTLLPIFISICLIVHLKLSWNQLSFLNSDYLTMLILKVNKLDLNCIIIFIYLFYILAPVVYKKSASYWSVPLLLIVYYITNVSDVYISPNLNEFYMILQDLSLSNGAVVIHPLMILIAYSLLISLLFSIISIDYFKITKLKHNYMFKSVFYVKKKGFNYSKVLIVSIFLGAYWAHQELNWGGYWSWDIVEVISLSIFSLFILTSHTLRLNPPVYLVKILLLLSSLLFFIVRLNIVQSVHGFLLSQSNVINMQYVGLYIVIAVLLFILLFIKFSSNSTSCNLRSYITNYLPCALLITTSVIIIYPILVSVLSTIYDDAESIKHQPFIVVISLPILWYLIDTPSYLSLVLPLNESILMLKFISNRKRTFFLRLYHLLMIIILYYSLSLSHVYILPIFLLELVNDTNPIVKLSTNYLSVSKLINDFSVNFSIYNYLIINDYSMHYYFTGQGKGQFTNLLVTSSTTTGTVDKSLLFELMLQKLGWTLPILILLLILTLLIAVFNTKRRVIFYY